MFEALGSIDSINANLGLAREHCSQIKDLNPKVHEQLVEIQARLIDLGSHIATPKNSEKSTEFKTSHTKFGEKNIQNLETWIDEYNEELPVLTNFILPSGGLAASQLHVARTQTRSAERDLVSLFDKEQIDPEAYQYVNRLSDYIFMLARYCA